MDVGIFWIEMNSTNRPLTVWCRPFVSSVYSQSLPVTEWVTFFDDSLSPVEHMSL
jgi:hypothetical protein